MFVDAETLKFITIRDISEMTLIDTALDSSRGEDGAASEHDGQEMLVISIRNTDKKVAVPARPTPQWLSQNTELKRVEIWEYNTDGYIYSEAINSICSEFLGKKVKLVYKGPEGRIATGNGAPNILGREESVNFPDVLPVLIANEASLWELNGRLEKKGARDITVERFRPNIIVRGGNSVAGDEDKAPKAWSEDTWKTIKILNTHSRPHIGGITSMFMGEGANDGLVIDIQARCARCQVPNVDPDTAAKNKHEPWDTLVSYRRVDAGIKWKPCFGMLGCPRNEGPIKVGMKFEVTEEVKGEHRYVKGF
jgi:uncharacterized protein YcbX